MDLILQHSNSVKKVDEKPTNLRAMGDDVQHLQLQLPRHDPEQLLLQPLLFFQGPFRFFGCAEMKRNYSATWLHGRYENSSQCVTFST